MNIEDKSYGLVDIIKIPYQCAPVLTVLISLQMVLSGIVPTLQILVTANFIDTAITIVQDGANRSLIYPALFGVVALIAYSWIAGAITKFAHVRMDIAIREQFRTAIIGKRAKLAYQHIENHETWNVISRVSQKPESQVKDGFNHLLSLTAMVIQIVGILVLLFTQVWWATLIILAFSVPLITLSIKSGKATYQANRDVSKYKRKVEYLSEVLTGRESVDERSLFGYGNKINETWYKEYETFRKIEYKTEKKWFIKMKLGSVITALLSILIILVLLGPVISGAITIGMYIALVNGVFGLVGNMSWRLTGDVDQLAKHREYLVDLSSFSALEETKGASDLPSSPSPVFQSLEFKNVYFTYPGTEKAILQGMSFRMTAGKHYAFVGINGAGKTTITKLITGLYDHFEGEIILNGKSISEYSQNELKSFYSIVYQDFAKYYISMEDNIALGDVNGLTSNDRLQRIDHVMDQVELREIERILPQGLQTPLGKIKDAGQDISGGQWQRIVMARAIVNPAPLRILDEPTAALDPLSESRLYEEFEQISHNKTTIFISHRLGSTKLADEIFVMGDGRVIEQGSHQELMKLESVYAEMYAGQRSWYQ